LAKGGIKNKVCKNATHCAAATATCEKDIEEISGKMMASCGGTSSRPTQLVITQKGVTWVRLASLQELYALLRSAKYKGEKVRIVRGNTMSGVYPPPPTNIIAEVSKVPELMKCSVGENGITIGGAVPISDFMNILDANKALSPSFEPLLKHLKRVSFFGRIYYFFTELLNVFC
jgi:hypothetical protein